jgi:hypothetical protein
MSPSNKLRENVMKVLLSVKLILDMFGCKSDITRKTVDHWVALAEDLNGNWTKVAKYKLAAFFSAHTSQPLPPSPFKVPDRPDFLVGGGQGRWLKHALTGTYKWELLVSLKQSKKGMPRVDKEELDKETVSFVQQITEPQEEFEAAYIKGIEWSNIKENVEYQVSKTTIINQINRTVDEIFKGHKMTWKDRVKVFFPSTSANYINNVKNAGSIGTILEHESLLKGLRVEGGLVTVEKRSEEEDYIEKDVVQLNTTRLEQQFEKLWVRTIVAANKEPNIVVPVALAEPLKIRMITKGPPLRQMVLRNIWKFVHTKLRNHRVFQLIGKPLEEEILLNVLGASLKEDEYYVSGDYKAATDNLKSFTSEATAEAIARNIGLGITETRLLLESLTQHEVEHAGFRTFQRRGQLMGSITSFPVLCLVNCALTRWSMEVAQGNKISLNDARLLINGDDVVFKTKGIGYKAWQQITAYAGLEESLGKTYKSRVFLEMNSTLYKVDKPHDVVIKQGCKEVVRISPYSLVQYINLGLLLGMKRSSGKVGLTDQTDPRNNMAARARQLLKFAPSESHTIVMREFIKQHKELLTMINLPWYIPEWLGGIGLPTGEWGTPSEIDLRIARRILIHWWDRKPIQLGQQEVSWKTWELASKALPEPNYTGIKDQSTEDYSHEVAVKCVDLLFDSNYSLEDLNPTSTSQNPWRAIKHNQALWRVTSDLPPPLELEKLEFQPLLPTYAVIVQPRGGNTLHKICEEVLD